ncbi:MAG: SPASM domain-containing protein, partial [Clostridia bacterium]|nr:SPASM domain-containing protein [Clostridia bacterium]
YLYLHLMGEPLTHPRLEEILKIADKYDFHVMLTTNGTLLDTRADTLFDCKQLFKISISVHAFEGNGEDEATLDNYLDKLISFADKSSRRGIITVFRLWNSGGSDKLNNRIISRLHDYSASLGEIPTPNRSGERLCDKTFIEWGEKFDWPNEDDINSLDDKIQSEDRFCYALRDQFGVLVDGTVVPCCLDHDGVLALGNIFESELDDILATDRARAIYDGFTKHKAVEKYCLTCKRVRPGTR